MLFVMGWSSIVLASSNFQPMNEQSHMLMLHDQRHASDQKQNYDHSHASSTICDHNKQKNHCEMKSDHQKIIHSLCQDCTTLHCQNTFSFIDIDEPFHIKKIFRDEFSKVFNTSYLIQFSMGYPQDLLRPPQV